MSLNEKKSWIDELEDKVSKPVKFGSISQYGENFNEYKLSREDNIIIQQNYKILKANPNAKIVFEWAKKNGLAIEKIFLLGTGINDFIEDVKKLLDQNTNYKYEWLKDEFISQFSKLKIKSSKTIDGTKNMDLFGYITLLKDVDINIESAGLNRERNLEERKSSNRPFYFKEMFIGSPVKSIIDKTSFHSLSKSIFEKKLSQKYSKKILLKEYEQWGDIYLYNIQDIQ